MLLSTVGNPGCMHQKSLTAIFFFCNNSLSPTGTFVHLLTLHSSLVSTSVSAVIIIVGPDSRTPRLCRSAFVTLRARFHSSAALFPTIRRGNAPSLRRINQHVPVPVRSTPCNGLRLRDNNSSVCQGQGSGRGGRDREHTERDGVLYQVGVPGSPATRLAPATKTP